jgi:hypothetical protein
VCLGGRWGSGQQHRVLSGRDGLFLVVVGGDGQLVVPVACAMRRPAPVGAGAPCRDKRRWTRTRRDERLAALRTRGLELPPPLVTGASGVGDSQLMTYGSPQQQGTVRVEGKTTYSFP